MLRLMRHLVYGARRYLASTRLSRRLNRLLHRVSSGASLPGTSSPKPPPEEWGSSSRDSVSIQLACREDGGLLSVPVSESMRYDADERGDNERSARARTRRARRRTQVLMSSSSHLMVHQVVTVLTQIGLTPEFATENRLLVTWPTETNLDCMETQDPLRVEMQIRNEQGIKFRRLSGPDNLFRWKLQEILAVVYDQCGW